MGGMWTGIRGGNGDLSVLRPDGHFLDKDIKKGYAKWMALPESERKPGSWHLVKQEGRPKGAPPGPPDGTVIVRVTQRNLLRERSGRLVHLTPQSTTDRARWGNWHPKYNDSFNDVMWLLADEVKSLMPTDTHPGQRLPLPEKVKKRMLLWHLTNRTFCVGVSWEEKDLRKDDLTLVVEEAGSVVKMRLEGSAFLKMDGSAEDKKIFWGRSEHGYDPRVLGFIEYDAKKKELTRFDVLAVGDYWGGDCEGGRHNVGKLPLAISFELPSGDKLTDHVLPVGGVALDKYLVLRSQNK